MLKNIWRDYAIIGVLLVLSALAVTPAYAQVTIPSYIEQATGNTKAGIGVNIIGSSSYTPATGVNIARVQLNTQILPVTNTYNSNGVVKLQDDTTQANSYPLATTSYAYDGTVSRIIRGDVNGVVVQPAFRTAWWKYVPPTGGLTNSTAGIAIKAAAGAGIFNVITGGECYSDAITTATELELRDGASGTALWRMKVPTTGWTYGFDINFTPPIVGTANTLVEFAEVTANGTGAIYCNWRGYTAS